MLAALRHFDWQVASRLDLSGVGLGHVATPPIGTDAVTGLARSGDLSLAYDGELYSAPPMPEGTTPAERLAQALLVDGPSFFAATHGCFACAVWDARSRRISLASDRFGMRPLYWTVAQSRFVFASEIGALVAAASGVSTARSERGLAEFLAFGHLLGESTLLESVRVVPAACWVTFDCETGNVDVTPYGDPLPRPEPRGDAEWLDEIDARLAASVRQCCDSDGPLGLSLSGGLDARTILGVAPADVPMTCVSLGIPGSIDHRAAAELARRAGRPHHAQMLQGDFLGRFEELLRDMARLTDGHYLDQGIVLTTLPSYRALGIATLLRGHAGELMHMSKAYAFSLDARGAAVSTRGELADWLWKHLTDYMIGGVDAPFFRNGFGARLTDLARESLEERLSAWDDVEPVPERIWRLFVAERLRRETALSLQMFRSFVEVRLPYLEPALVAALLAAPVHLKMDDTIQTHVLRRRMPSFVDVVNANTGAPLGAGAARTKLAQLKLRVYSKLRVPGYQPYERLGLWLARDLQPLVRRLLLSNDSVAVELFERAAVEALIDQHAKRQRNHTFLLMALIILQLGRERLEQGSGAAQGPVPPPSPGTTRSSLES
jgi:asparagine synthase (glutamine-hydrolysing)